MARDETQLKFRVPADLRAWLDERTAKSLRSLNNEVVFILKGERDRETETAGEPAKTAPTV